MIHLEKSDRQRWRDASVWLVNNISSRSLGFVRNLIIARTLSTSEASFGFLSLSIAEGTRTLGETGTNQLLITGDAIDDELLASAWFLELAKGLVIASLLSLLALAAGYDAIESIAWPVFLLASSVPLARSLVCPTIFEWERNKLARRVTAVTLVGQIGGLVALALFTGLNMGWSSIPLAIAFGHLLVAAIVVGASAGPALAKVRPTRRGVRTLLLPGLSFTAVGFANYLSNYGLDLFLALGGATHLISPFRLAFATVITLLSALPAVFARTSLAHDSSERRRRGGHNSIHLPSFILVAVVIELTAVASWFALVPLAIFVYGSEWQSLRDFVPWLLLVLSLRSINMLLGTQLIAASVLGRENVIKVMESVLVALCLGFVIPTDLELGFLGALLSSAVALAARLLLLKFSEVSGTGTATQWLLSSAPTLTFGIVSLTGALNVELWVGGLALGVSLLLKAFVLLKRKQGGLWP